MTSELERPLTEVEVPVENEASEYRHKERCSEVQGMSDDESEVQCGDEEEGRAASEGPWSADDSRDQPACRVTFGHTVVDAPTASEEEAEAGSTVTRK